MSNITLTSPKSLICWLQLYLLYRRSFPRAERKPFPTILKKYHAGMTDIWCICRDDQFLGFASTMNSPDLIMLDYLVIAPKYRGQGIGTAAFALAAEYCLDVMGLTEIYAGCYEGNIRSRRMLAACGFVPHPEGNCEEVHFLTGEPIVQYDFIKRK